MHMSVDSIDRVNAGSTAGVGRLDKRPGIDAVRKHLNGLLGARLDADARASKDRSRSAPPSALMVIAEVHEPPSPRASCEFRKVAVAGSAETTGTLFTEQPVATAIMLMQQHETPAAMPPAPPAPPTPPTPSASSAAIAPSPPASSASTPTRDGSRRMVHWDAAISTENPRVDPVPRRTRRRLADWICGRLNALRSFLLKRA
jgi:hypothetical protein